MQRPSAVFPSRPESPVAIESRALGTLAYIRTSIESSSSMDVPGMAGIVMGTIGALTAIAVSLPRWASHWLGIWLVAAVIALLLGGAMVARQVAHRGHSRYWGPARKFLLCLCPALLAGAVMTLVLWNAAFTAAIPGMWLLLYGCAVLSASSVTSAGIAKLICGMGALFVVLGATTFLLPANTHTLMLGVGFGGLHIVFGVRIGNQSNVD